MADDRIRILEERLTRLEATLAQRVAGTGTGTGGFTPPGGVITDPAPWGGGFISDPPPWGGWGWPYGPWGRPRWPTPVVDPGPFPNPVVDPAVFGQQATAATLGRIGKIGDPPPPDVGRFSQVQLETTLHSIAAEKARLDSMEQLVKNQLETLKKQQPG